MKLHFTNQRNQWALSAGVAVVSLVVCAGMARGQAECEFDLLAASDAAQAQQFGRAIAADGDLMVVGSYNDNENGPQAGAAWVFRRIGEQWIEEDKLLPADGGPYDRFGSSVAISGETIVIGAEQHNAGSTNSGAAYLFMYNHSTGSWEQFGGASPSPTLLPSDPSSNKRFGSSVAIDGNTILVGAYNDSLSSCPQPGGVSGNSCSNTGSAYVYQIGSSQWPQQQQKLTASDGGYFHTFGHAVSISGNTAIIGASQARKVYVFDKGATWTETVAIDDPSPISTATMFGVATALEGDKAVVGAPIGLSAGRAYIFERTDSGWVLAQTLIPSDNPANAQFGNSVDLAGSKIIVGAASSSYLPEGAAYLFGWEGFEWIELVKLVPSEANPMDYLGTSVALTPSHALIGARQHAPFGVSTAGAVFSLSLVSSVASDCLPDVDPDPVSCPADVDGSGMVDVGDLLTLLAVWGPCAGCVADLNGDNRVDVADLLLLLSEWGACPAQ